ncbi:MAG: transcriptional activator protein [Gemmatimonadetes bacterium]|nr:transcriptional activator protein [Gemmatimonadota bacterium]
MTLRLRTFGSVYLSKDGELLSGAAGQRRLLAILSVLATAGSRAGGGGVSRDKLLALLWSEGDPDKSRHALTQSLYHIRRALGVEQIFLQGADLRLNPVVIASDVGDFQSALHEGRLADAAEAYGGPFLDGFYLNGGPEFDFWVSVERDRLSRAYADVLKTLAESCARAGDTESELRWRSRLADHDPLDGAAVAQLMTCMMAAGDAAGALQRARAHESRMREELDLPPDRAVVALVARLREQPPIAAIVADAPVRDAAAPDRHDSALDGAESVGAQVAPVSVEAPTATHAVARRRRLSGGARWALAAAALVGVAAALGGVVSRLANARAAVQASTIMVAPFHVADTDPATAYLREGLLDLLTTRIADADTKRAADPARVLQAWRRAGYGRDSAVSVIDASRVARDLDAGEVVIGSVESSPAGVIVHVSLVDAIRARVKAKADVRGSPDSLIVLTDRIISGLILTEAGDRVGSLPPTESISPAGLRAYLAGRSAYRRADYYGASRSYEQALAQDQGFALAALGLAMAADRANAAEQHDRGLALAWARQADLPPADRAYLRAFAGPRYPEPSSAAEALAAWERVVRVAPDRAEGWHELGESFYYDAEVLGMHDGPVRAEDSFRHALQLDPTFAPSRRMLSLLLARQRDTAALRRLIADDQTPDTADAMSVFVRWRAANALGDTRELSRVRRAFDGAPNGALRAIAMTSQFDGVSIDDGDRALEILRRRQLSDAEEVDVALARHSRALNSGDFASALAITSDVGARQPALHPQLRLRVLDALYSNGDYSAALAAAAQLERFVDGATPGARADSAVRLADACVVGQWRLSVRDTSGARAALRVLRTGGVLRFTVPVGANPSACAELLDASLAIAERGAAAHDRLAHLDSLMLSGPAVSDAMRYANLVVAREYQSIGDPRHAAAALQRRSYMRGWPRYRATGLELLTELSLALGDTATARSATERLMATKRHPVLADAAPPTMAKRFRFFSRRLVH